MTERVVYKIINKFRRKMYKIQYKILKKQVEQSEYVYGINQKQRDIPNVIVSLTSYPKRFEDMDLCLKSILNQNFKPDKIIIWLGSDTNKEKAEISFGKYKKYGIEYIIDSKNNYFSHKKYIYAFEKYKESIIITLDDDLIYPKNTLKTLIKKYEKHPNSIVARRVHKITWDKSNINKYTKWIWECFTIRKPSNKLCATTGAGTLFPPKIYTRQDINYKTIEKYALTADDIWLKMMAVKNNVKIVWAGNFLQMPPEVNPEKDDALTNLNVINNRNDEYIKKILCDYNLTKKDFE